MKKMILCTGIKGVGVYDGEFLINLPPRTWKSKEVMTVVRYRDVDLMTNGAELYTLSFDKAYSWSLSSPERLCHYKQNCVAECLVMLGVITRKQLDDRYAELNREHAQSERSKKSREFADMCESLGIKPTAKQLQRIGRRIRK